MSEFSPFSQDPEVLASMPLTADLVEHSAEEEKKAPLEKYLNSEIVSKLTNLFDELAKKYEDMSYDSTDGLDFADELSTRAEEIFASQKNEVSESVKFSFGKMGEVLEEDLAFSLDEERASGGFVSEKEEKILEWFDNNSQKEMLHDMVKWQQEAMKMTQWLSMLEGGDVLINQFYERWRQFAGKRLGAEGAESIVRGITGPLLFSKLCDEAGYDVFLPDVVWDRDEKIDFLIKDKSSQDMVYATQMKSKKAGNLGVRIEGSNDQSDLQGKALKEKESLEKSVGKFDRIWSGKYGIRMKPLFVTVDGLIESQYDLGTGEMVDKKLKSQLIENIKQSLANQIGSEEQLAQAA
ncbi:TPA: hypothetical protein DD449_04660 [Candidatus Berkelbacteria bacterium]|uniref:Uncharacterized protein n=1 Tax=Berkelbacteria bacterium GW2011_GWE1_39_12 TaxID=1618337 RepID=A0A0G4B448_9BACT|nr:MAG: hypothetical protein UT28_C0001G0551 [Berkelbacteria bacterium GW2011_GWE1_39_12]HBO60946.1 hypothetical protein [Candidatus Berkelbacteria bacterium]